MMTMALGEYAPGGEQRREASRGECVLTVPAVREFLVAHVDPGVGDILKFGHGEWSQAFAFSRDGKEYVIRFSAVLEDFAKDRLAAAFASPRLPIPRVTELGDAFDGYFAISERAPGQYLDELGEAGMRAVLPALFASLDAARQVNLSATSGYGGWGADGNAPWPSWRAALLDAANDRPTDSVHGWRESLAASPVGSGPFDAAFEHLRSLVAACPEERCLIHSDLLNYNVLVSGDRLTAVLDWGCSLYGDFLYDLAWITFWAPWYAAWQEIDFQAEAQRWYASIGLAVPHFEERLRCYEVHIGLGSQAYAAFKGRWEFLARVAQRTLDAAIAHRSFSE